MTDTNEQLTDQDKLIMCACKAAAVILERHGLEPHEIANGMIGFGGAIAIEMCGASEAAAIFRSKADGIAGVMQ